MANLLIPFSIVTIGGFLVTLAFLYKGPWLFFYTLCGALAILFFVLSILQYGLYLTPVQLWCMEVNAIFSGFAGLSLFLFLFGLLMENFNAKRSF